MSYYQFIASDERLPDLENEKLISLSINEAYERGLVFGDYGMSPEDVVELYEDKDAKGACIYCENEEDLDELSIIEEDEFSDYSSGYTEKEFRSSINWKMTDERAEKLVNYIKEHMESTDEVEVWTILLDDEDTSDSDMEIVTCNLDEFDSEVLTEAMNIEEYSCPICLKIIK